MFENFSHPFDQRLVENKLLPWWEVLRAFLLGSILILFTYTLAIGNYINGVVCMTNEPWSGKANDLTTTTANFVNSICKTQLPWHCKHLGSLMICFVILHIIAEKWWLALPRVKSAISALGELKEMNSKRPKEPFNVYWVRCWTLVGIDFALGFVIFYYYKPYQSLIPGYMFECALQKITSGQFNMTGDFFCTYDTLDALNMNLWAVLVFLSLSVLITLFFELNCKKGAGNFVDHFFFNSEMKEVLEMKHERAKNNINESTNRDDVNTPILSADPLASSDDNNNNNTRR